jgi:hypothetical protein
MVRKHYIIINLFKRRLWDRLASHDYYEFSSYGDPSIFRQTTTHLALQRVSVGVTLLGALNQVNNCRSVFTHSD